MDVEYDYDDGDISIFMEIPNNILEGKENSADTIMNLTLDSKTSNTAPTTSYISVGENAILRAKLEATEAENQKLKMEIFRERKNFEKEKDAVMSNSKSEIERLRAEWMFKTHTDPMFLQSPKHCIDNESKHRIHMKKEVMKSHMSSLYVKLQTMEFGPCKPLHAKSSDKSIRLLIDVMSWQSRPFCESYFEIIDKWLKELSKDCNVDDDSNPLLKWFIEWMWLLEVLHCRCALKRYYISDNDSPIHESILDCLVCIYSKIKGSSDKIAKDIDDLIRWRIILLQNRPETSMRYQFQLEKICRRHDNEDKRAEAKGQCLLTKSTHRPSLADLASWIVNAMRTSCNNENK